MRLNVALNEELGIRIWSFPMRYQPTNLPDRSYVGEKWTRYQLRSMQTILQATHGIVSGEPDFFKRAFGNTSADFEALLLWPHRYIFNRDWYEKWDGVPELDEYKAEITSLSDSERGDLLNLLSSCDARDYGRLGRETRSDRVRRVLQFYLPLSKEEERIIWDRQKAMRVEHREVEIGVAEDERVEDAGLDDDTFASPAPAARVRRHAKRATA
jgi:hypothetical protein